MGRGPVKTRIWWRLVDILSRMLDTDERQIVRGDIAESGETGSQAVSDVLGLVVRRHAVLWTHWRPWLSLVGLIVPLGMLLSIVSKGTSGSSAIYIWMYANNWEWGDVRNPGFLHEFAHCVALILLSYLTLVCWSWTSGFVLGSLSRGIIRVNGVLFCLMLLFGVLLGAPLYVAYYWQYLHRALGFPNGPDVNAPVFAQIFYSFMLPVIVQTLLVVLPSLWGMRQGVELAKLRPLLRTILSAAAIATLAEMVIQSRDLWFFFNLFGRAWSWQGWSMRLLQVVAYWPVGYLISSAIWRRSHGRIAAMEQRGLK